MLSLLVDSSVMQLRHEKRLRDIGQNRCPYMRILQNAAMDQWHDLKYLDFMRETLWMANLQYAGADLILCGRSVYGWHVRCWCGLREVENSGKTLPYLKI